MDRERIARNKDTNNRMEVRTRQAIGGLICRGRKLLWSAPLLLLSLSVLGPVCNGQLIGNDKGSSVKDKLFKQHSSGPETMEYIKSRGFIGEQFALLSKDNSPLAAYHIINPLADQRTLNRFPVLIHHGIGADAAQMVAHSDLAKPRKPVIGQITYDLTDTCLAFMLANNNFDVYLVDARGTNMNNHRAADEYNLLLGQKFWNYSLDEQALDDLPTFVDFVLDQTKEEKLHYVGFSQSTLFALALWSSMPAYQDKFASAVLLAPVAYIEHTTSLAVPLLSVTSLLPEWYNGNMIPQLLEDTTGGLAEELCQFDPIGQTLCKGLTSSLSGVGNNELSHGFFVTNLKSTSIKAVRHLIQLYIHKRFGMYDYGTAGNMKAYGQPKPPKYDLSKITLPTIILFRGGKDLLSDTPDQERLVRELGVKPYLDFKYPHYNHADMIISKNIIFDIHLPAAKAMLDLLKLQARPPGSILRDPVKMLLPKRYKPVNTVTPDGSRTVSVKANLVGNLVNAYSESITGDVIDVGPGVTVGPLTQTVMKQELAG